MYRKLTTLGALAFSAALLLPAQTTRSMDRDDRNNDGMISRREWRGTARQFRALDINRDGMLSGDELIEAGYDTESSSFGDQSDRRVENERYRTDNDRNVYGQQTQTRGRAVDRLDKNRSGKVEGYEWPYNPDVFHQLDTDHDSALSQDELANINKVTMQELDKNHNGRIEADEWPGGFAEFDRLDQNGDGKLTANEYFQRGGEWQKRSRFDSWDTNHDGVLDQSEWQTTGALFRRVDTNRDGRVDWNEYLASEDRYDKPFGWR